MSARDVYGYYAREDVQKALIRISEGREVVGVFGDGAFSTRPNVLVYPKDITLLVKSGAVAFHGSLEKWSNPMAVGSQNYERLRTGWDLILDLDCEDTEHGKVAALAFMSALKKHGVKSASVKFTGGTGFHLGLPAAAMPRTVDYKETAAQYPGLARSIALYLREFARKTFEEALLKRWTVEELAAQTGRQVGDIMTPDGIDPYKIVEVDPVLISPRHLFRLPYSLHEKSQLVSLPLGIEEIEGFRKEDASPEKVKAARGFMDGCEEEEASLLVTEAMDWAARMKIGREKKAVREYRTVGKAIPIELAPPCVGNIMKGLSDGKKRSLLIMINYLSSVGWSWDEIRAELFRWNEKNTPPLSETYIRSQTRWHENRKKRMPPPNCRNPGYYESFGVCQPDSVCGGAKKSIKNPVNYALKKAAGK